jgi:hypothetical protein
MQILLAAESHVPCFQERVGTSLPGYMIPERLPWRLRARPSATLHEIGSAPSGANLFQRSYKKTTRTSRGNSEARLCLNARVSFKSLTRRGFHRNGKEAR